MKRFFIRLGPTATFAYFIVAIVLMSTLVAGCDSKADKQEIARLQERLGQAIRDQQEMSKTVPSEQPAVIKELATVKAEYARLQAELTSTRQALARSNDRVPGEILPLATWLKTLQKRVDEIEPLARNAAKKGHTHAYHKGDSILHSTTDPDQ